MMNVSQKNFEVKYLAKNNSGGLSDPVCETIRAYSDRQLTSILTIKLKLKDKKLVKINNVKEKL